MQTFLALAIVFLTFAIFAWRWWSNRNKKGCGGGCDCARMPVKKTSF